MAPSIDSRLPSSESHQPYPQILPCESTITQTVSNAQLNIQWTNLTPFIVCVVTFGFISILLIRWFRTLTKVIHRTNSDDIHLNGKTVLITGASEGIGACLAKQLARKGSRLVLLCRDTVKATVVQEEILAENPTTDVIIHHLDLSSFTSIQICVSEILQSEQRIDYLVHCASVAYIPENTKSVDGNELHMATNHFGPFLLTHLLVDRMRSTANKYETIVKVIHLNTMLHRIGKIHLQDINTEQRYRSVMAYAQSRLAQILVQREWSRLLKKDKIHFYTIDPGFCSTNSSHYDHLPTVVGYFIQIGQILIGHSTANACSRIVSLFLQRYDNQTGYYYSGDGPNIVKPATQAMDDKMAKNLWEQTIKLCSVEPPTKTET